MLLFASRSIELRDFVVVRCVALTSTSYLLRAILIRTLVFLTNTTPREAPAVESVGGLVHRQRSPSPPTPG
eukprot:COSAG04_NODE_22974_length_346_cov_0.631579_1_plen_70_part_10